MECERTGCLELLLATPYRRTLLSKLTQCARSVAHLRDVTGIPRATIQRNLRALCEADLVRRENGTYEITNSGRRTFELFTCTVEKFEETAQFTPFLNQLSDAGKPPTPSQAKTTTVTETDSMKTPALNLAEKLASSDTLDVFWTYLPKTMLEFWSMQPASKKNTTIWITSSSSTISETELERVEGTVGNDIRVTESGPKLNLYLRDHCEVIFQQTQQHPKGYLATEDENVRKWAEQTFERMESSASETNDQFVEVRNE